MNKKSEHIVNDLLVMKYQAGDKAALQVLIKQFHPRLEKQVYIQTRDSSSLDDIVQDCWYAIINGLKNVELRISFDVWALSIARRKGIDWIREQQRARRKLQNILVETEIEQQADELEILDQQLDNLNRMKVAINDLPQSQRMVLSMFYLENQSIKEISEILGISLGTVKSRLFTAREHLKEILKLK